MNRVKVQSPHHDTNAPRLREDVVRNLSTFAFIVVSFLLNGCQREDVLDFPQPLGDKVHFKSETIDTYATRSAGYTTNGTNSILSMGIYAAYAATSWANNSPLNFMTNQKVERSYAGAEWRYEPEQLWPGSGSVSFFAYAPHSANAVWNGNPPSIDHSAGGIPTISHKVASHHTNQVDLLIATPQKNQTKRDYITIPLRHALTKISFSARVANTPAAGVSYRVTQITISGLHGEGSCSMDGENRSWILSDTNDKSYMVAGDPDNNGGLKPLFPLTSTYQSITTNNGYLFPLPQQLTENAKVKITYVTQVGNSPEEQKEIELPLALAISRFRAGEAYNMLITIDNGVSFIVAPTPWDDTEINADIKNRILNVTRIEANVYPGIATRIWFWSNQPKDSVYVRPEGNLDDGNKRPGNTEYTVNNLFQYLSSANAINLTYRSIDEAPIVKDLTLEKGEGYIDVLLVTGATAPYNPILPDGSKRHIWLNASGLARNILLNTIDRTNRTTTPYVGTFHRWNETGERVISWGFNNNWTADVVDGAGDILIDNQPSPYMATGQLYGDGDVGDPEAAQLASTATVPISGTGRIYFRVGWRSTLPSSNTPPRYGRIRVTEYSLDGTTITNTHYLYVRQGESDDYVMPNDVNRPASVKWSPYNLTAVGLSEGGAIAVNTDRSNIRFTKYPTQAGAIVEWKSPASTPLYVFAPVGRLTNWAVDETYSGFWSSIKSMEESCPPGYRRPNRGSISASVATDVTVSAEVIHSLFEIPNYMDVIWNTSAANSPSNSLWGYYADGFFDRRKVEPSFSDLPTPNSAVEASKVSVGYIGRLFYDLASCRSIFFPAAGFRSDEKQHEEGLSCFYWSSSALTDTRTNASLGWCLVAKRASAGTGTDNLHGMSVRCVRDLGFSTTLPDYNETVVPVALSYNANSSAINASFVSKWNVAMLNDIGSLSKSKIRARVTFEGTVTGVATDLTVSTVALLAHTAFDSGSTITYDFNRPTWNSNTEIRISIENTNWEYSSDSGNSWSQGQAGIAARLTAKRSIILRKR